MTPEPHATGAMLLVLLALGLFLRDGRIPLESSALLILTLLMAGFYLFPYETAGGPVSPWIFLNGFGNEALITICALVVCAKALETTGALWPVAHFLSAEFARRPTMALLLTLLTVAGLSMFINNTPVVAITLPILISVCLRTGQDASRILMPAGFATIIGGMCTTIGTSTNLLVTNAAAELGMHRMSMFEFTLPAVIAALPGLLFLWLLAPRILPGREAPTSDTSPRLFKAVLVVEAGGFAAGKTLRQLQERTHNALRLENVERTDGVFLARRPSLVLHAGDRLHIRDTPIQLKEFERLLGGTIRQTNTPSSDPAANSEQQLAEVVIGRDSPLHNRTLSSTKLLERFHLTPLAIHRAKSAGTTLTEALADTPLWAADILLVQGARKDLARFRQTTQMLVLDGGSELPYTKAAPWALAIVGLVVLLAATGLVPILLGAVCGMTALLLGRCLTWEQALKSLDRRLVLIIVTSIGLSEALMLTGATQSIAVSLSSMLGDLPPWLVISTLVLITALITEIVTNNATALLSTPIAFLLAQQLGMDPEPFVLAVLFGANMSYITPVGYQTNMLVFSAGGYRFTDFLKVGIPLQIILGLSFSFVLILFYDL